MSFKTFGLLVVFLFVSQLEINASNQGQLCVGKPLTVGDKIICPLASELNTELDCCTRVHARPVKMHSKIDSKCELPALIIPPNDKRLCPPTLIYSKKMDCCFKRS